MTTPDPSTPDATPADTLPADAPVPADTTAPADAPVPADGTPADAAPADAASVDARPADAGRPDVTPTDADPGPAAATDAASAGDAQAADSVPAGPTAPQPPAAPAPVPGQAGPCGAQPPVAPAPFGATAPPPYGYGPPPYPHPGQPGGVPAQTQWALPPAYAPKARKARPWLRTVARWTSAVAVMVVVGAVTTALVVRPARTDVPGLATPSDGRWTFPTLTLPTLPPGNGPDGASAQHVHRVDLRQLLLPAPDGATAVTSLPGTRGWLPSASLLALFANPGQVNKVLQDSGLRHTAATGWTMPDGTRTEIYLQQFRSQSSANDVDVVESVDGYLVDAPDAGSAAGIELTGLGQATTRSAPASGGHPQVTYAYLQAGDTEVLVVMSNPKSVPAVDFEQVVELQNRLLTA